jgi:hypothetical protein
VSRIKGAKTGMSRGRVVVIRCDKKRGMWDAMFDDKAVAPFPDVKSTTVISHLVSSKAEFDKALGTLTDGDMLILNAHSSAGHFQYPDGERIKKVEWPDIWSHAKINMPPRLSAVMIAGCMKVNEIVPPISMDEIKKIRQALHATVLIVPYRTYKTSDLKPAGKAMDDIIECYSGKIGTTQFLERFRNQDRFGVSFGCNGYNHPAGCACGFGMPRHLGKELDRALSFMKWLLPKM